MKGHNYGLCRTCGKEHIPPKGNLGHNFGDVPCKKCGKIHIHPNKGKPSCVKGMKFPKELYPNKGMRNKNYTEEHRRHLSDARIKLFKENKLIVWNKGRKGIYTEETIKKMKRADSITMTRKWNEDLEYANKVVAGVIKACHKSPNNEEILLDSIIQNIIPNNYIYTGNNWKFIVNGHLPDWTNTNGQKKVILYNGIYWHFLRHQKSHLNLSRDDIMNIEEKPYKEFGFKVLFIWEDELNDIDKLKEKVKEFDTR